MSNPYLDPVPQPPVETPAKPAPWQWIIGAIAVVALFLPPTAGWNSDWLPVPIPIVDDTVDPAKTDGSWIVVIEETNDRTPEISKVLGDLPYWRSLNGRGLNWRFYDKDASEAAVYKALYEDVGTPTVLVLGGKDDMKGKVLAKFQLTSKDDLDAQIKKATGR